MLTFYRAADRDFPAEHRVSIRTTNPIESTFATIRHRTDQAKGCVTRNTMLAMIDKFGLCAEQNWRRLRGFRHLAEVIAGRRFKEGVEVAVGEETEQRIAA